MIHDVSGDILLSDAQAIAHGVAPHDDFHQGLALELRKRYPSMFRDFKHFCHVSSPSPGELWTWGGVEGARIINLLTQEPPGSHGDHPGPAKLKHVNHALHALRREIEQKDFKSIAMTRLATGVGGLDWPEVRALIGSVLEDLNIPIYIYAEYHAGVKAEEPAA